MHTVTRWNPIWLSMQRLQASLLNLISNSITVILVTVPDLANTAIISFSKLPRLWERFMPASYYSVTCRCCHTLFVMHRPTSTTTLQQSYNKCCKLCCANASRHVMLSLQKVLSAIAEEISFFLYTLKFA